MKKNSEVGPAVVPEGRNYGAARCGSRTKIRIVPESMGLKPTISAHASKGSCILEFIIIQNAQHKAIFPPDFDHNFVGSGCFLAITS